jgi:Mg2+ and Co2+ transporter CorA
LRFTQRYWFHAVSDQAQSRDLFAMMSSHLETSDLFEKTRRRILDMTEYLDSDQLKQQAETVIRLTVVTAFGLIGTVVTGVLGMNLFAEADKPASVRLLYFTLVFIPVTVLTLYTIVKSKRLSVFLDALSDESMTMREKWGTLVDVWGKKTSL